MANLSLNGIVSLSHQLIKDGKTNLHNVELNQEDFEGIVMLTTKEAEELAVTLFFYHEICQRFFLGLNDMFYMKATKVRHNLDKKLDKAECSDVAV